MLPTNQEHIKKRLVNIAEKYENPSFIQDDPIGVAHAYTTKQDIEIASFIACTFAWGLRKTIINKTIAFLTLMGPSPIHFLKNLQPHDLDRFDDFVHRTFQPTDAKYFIKRLAEHYQENDSLETMFFLEKEDENLQGAERMKKRLILFHDRFFNRPDAPQRTRKHLATPLRGSSCKRVNMFLRWMVRSAEKGVDFGLWKTIKPSELIIPLDVHVQRVATKYGLLDRKQADWKAAVELTEILKSWEPNDPVKHDFSLFIIGVLGLEMT